MSASANEDLPQALQSVRTRALFVMRLDVKPMQVIGATPSTYRRIGPIVGGSFAGERLAGAVLDQGSDWQSVRADGATMLDVRLVLKTHDAALIGMTYRGLRHGAADVIARLDRGEAVDPASYYFRIMALFETAAEQYGWLNRLLAVGIGDRRSAGPVYSMFEVL